MLFPLVTTLVLFALGALIVAKLAYLAMGRLGLEFWSVMLWFGIAEALPDELSVRRVAPMRHLNPVRNL